MYWFYLFFFTVLSISSINHSLTLNDIHISQFDGTFFLFVGIVFIASFFDLVKKRALQINLSLPIIMVLCYYKPLIIVIGCVFFACVLSCIRNRFLDHTEEKFLNSSSFLQLTINIIFITLFKGILNQILLQSIYLFVLKTTLLIAAYLGLIFLLNYVGISIKTRKNLVKDINIKEFLQTVFSTIVVFNIILFSHQAYEFMGVLFCMILVIQANKSTYSVIDRGRLNNNYIKDPMTNAYNRGYFEDIINLNVEFKKTFTILFIDLDDFKKVNDTYGHVIGDGLLIDFVAILKTILRKENKIFRYGGDEFCILFDSSEEALGFKQRLTEITFMYKESSLEDEMIHYNISMGLLDYTGEEQLDSKTLINLVDQNMYSDKRQKKSNDILALEN